MSDWVYFSEDNSETYPPEGVDVLVSDYKNNIDVAWFLQSSEYKWVKNDVLGDSVNDFTSIKPIKWKKIRYED